jgi:hypothetical protein
LSGFTKDPLQLVLIDASDGRAVTSGGRCIWKLASPLRYDVGEEGSGETITVPAGATTDLASIPRLAWTLFPPDGPWLKAAVLHDFLYRSRGTCWWDGFNGRTRAEPYSRKESDGVFREAMAVLGVPGWKRGVIHTAVRLGGAAAWGG